MKIYTKTGDNGTTSLVGGERTEKYDLRVEAYGAIDELMAFVALLADKLKDDERTECFVDELKLVECRLMSASALLAVDVSLLRLSPIGNYTIVPIRSAICGARR